jgi:hypothetical protein
LARQFSNLLGYDFAAVAYSASTSGRDRSHRTENDHAQILFSSASMHIDLIPRASPHGL